jgi:hypothetical protein
MENEKIEQNSSNENEIKNPDNIQNQNIINDNQNDYKNENKIQENLKIKPNDNNESNELTQQTLYEECDSDNSAL